MSRRALVIIDLQNDYFPEGKFPLWNTEQTLNNIQQAISSAQTAGDTIVLVQHIADPAMGISPFFNKDTDGAEIRPEILTAAPDAIVVEKSFADSFEKTHLKEVLTENNIEELLLCGMMTQNCVTHTAISKAADAYKVSILMDSCTTVDEMIHNIALHAVSTRVALVPTAEAF